MNNYWSLYLLTRLDNLVSLFTTLTIVSLIGVLFLVIIYSINWIVGDYNSDGEGTSRAISKQFKWLVPLSLVFSFLLVATPSKNEAIFIVAGGKTMDFIQNDTTINKIPAQTTILISEFLEKQINEVKASGSVTSK